MTAGAVADRTPAAAAATAAVTSRLVQKAREKERDRPLSCRWEKSGKSTAPAEVATRTMAFRHWLAAAYNPSSRTPPAWFATMAQVSQVTGASSRFASVVGTLYEKRTRHSRTASR